jgi:hypothetical protein
MLILVQLRYTVPAMIFQMENSLPRSREAGKEDRMVTRKLRNMAVDFFLINLAGAETITQSDFRGNKPVSFIFGN